MVICRPLHFPPPPCMTYDESSKVMVAIDADVGNRDWSRRGVVGGIVGSRVRAILAAHRGHRLLIDRGDATQCCTDGTAMEVIYLYGL